MSDKEVILTPEGLHNLEKELEYLRTTKRRDIAARIKQAIEFGDISDNSEYEDAKNEQAFVEGRIAQLEKMLRNAKIIEGPDGDGDAVSVGSTVVLKDLNHGDVEQYTIVGSAEANPSRNRISNESPVGRAVLGKTVGSIVEVNVPVGTIRYEVVQIAR
ncbi:MAG: transcription elongation factor GreA [Bacillota bacterium]|jgi:transcription elongation factor GreA|nr:transcription elongation factor GreA [Bacillota bacterium]HOB42580.1 transcription elongation factor GreA [Bacillota bacterium]HOK70873.1 transcription elongation factor GreA [Bacillota bacterium]HOL50665.1 transcription elongation factor GreA [Bacillota bacterium]HOO30107.1 transcription elongation factor GreA [Bacillota bacterium]